MFSGTRLNVGFICMAILTPLISSAEAPVTIVECRQDFIGQDGAIFGFQTVSFNLETQTFHWMTSVATYNPEVSGSIQNFTIDESGTEWSISGKGLEEGKFMNYFTLERSEGTNGEDTFYQFRHASFYENGTLRTSGGDNTRDGFTCSESK